MRSLDQSERSFRTPKAGGYATLDYTVRNQRPQSLASFQTMTTRHNKQKGSVKFNQQTNRPGFPTNQLSEHRFQYVNHFPTARSNSKPIPSTMFHQQIARKNELTEGI